MELLAEVASKHIDYDTEDVSVDMNNLDLELSSLIDLDVTTSLNDRSELAADRTVEHDTGVVQAASRSRHTDTQDTINSLMLKLKAAEEDAFSCRCRVSELTCDLEATKT